MTMKTTRLNNGVMMPVMGYGVWQIKPEERETIRRLDVGHPLAADFNDPVLARYLLGYDKQFNPERQR